MSKRKMTALQLPVSAQPCWTSQGCSNLHFSTSAVRLVCLSSGKDQKISWCVLNSINSKATEERMEMGEYRDAPCVQQELGRYTGDSLEGRWEETMRWGRHSRNDPFLLFPDHYYCILNCLADVLRIWLIRVGTTHSSGQVFSVQVITSPLLSWKDQEKVSKMLQQLEPRRPWQEKAALGEARAKGCVQKAAQQFLKGKGGGNF